MAGGVSFSKRRTLIEKLAQLPWFMLTTIIAIAAFGTLILVSATHGDATVSGLAGDHAIRFAAALVFAIGLAATPIRYWSWIAYPAYVGALALLVGVELVGVEAGGAQRWLQIGPIRAQPSELMKIALLLALARYYHRVLRKGPAGPWVHVGAFLIIACPVALILKQPDLGTSLLLAATGGTVIFFAGLSPKVIAAGVAMVVIGAPTAYFFALADYQKARVQTFLDPSRDPLGAGYQLQQAKIAIGSGGVSGKGYLQGTQSQLEYIPEQHTDFVFTIIAEEFGLVGALAVLIAWGVALWQGLLISARSENAFGALAGAGVVATLGFYVVVNIGMVMGLMPVVGVPLPLISYGGTAMLTVMVGFGLLMAVHIHRKETLS